jgi:hypothetical protein
LENTGIPGQSTVPRENHQSADNPQYPEKTINLPTIKSTQRKPSSIIETKVLLPQE